TTHPRTSSAGMPPRTTGIRRAAKSTCAKAAPTPRWFRRSYRPSSTTSDATSKARDNAGPARAPDPSLTAIADTRLEPTLALLEDIVADRSLLATLPEDQRKRLLQAVALVHHPEPRTRRREAKARARELAQEKARRTEALLDRTGIRTLRSKPVFSTPNYFPPQPPGQHDPHNRASDPVSHNESPELLHCYVCKQKYTQVHHFYDQLCPACAELNFFKRTETADLRGRVALLTGGRVKIGYYAGLKL